MKKVLHLLLFLLLVPLFADGQQQWPTYVFAINARQAGDIYRQPSDSIDLDWLDAPIDSFRSSGTEQPRQAGHYLYIQPNREAMAISIRSYHHFRVEVRNNDRDLALEVVDATGTPRKDAELSLRRRHIPYDESTASYRLKNWAKAGLLRVAVAGDTLFYDLGGTTPGPLLFRKINYWRSSTGGYWLTTPIRWLENTYAYAKRGIAWGDWNPHFRPFRFLRRKPGFKGYIAMSQPSYRPGDTLQLKAYLARQNGRPWNRPARLRIYAYPARSGGRQEYVDTLLTASGAGNYLFNWPLSDSLVLDLDYYISLEHSRRENFSSLNHSFTMEDYELDEATFSLSLAQKEVHRGEKIMVQAEGRDQNDQFVTGAEVELTLLTESIDQIYQDSLSIADTLWTSRQALHDRESTQILLPDSIFPAADLEVKLHANFVHPSGALQQEEQSFHFQHRWEELILRLETDTVVMEYLKDGVSQPLVATLVRSGISTAQGESAIDTVQLPHRELVSPYLQRYVLTANDQIKVLLLAKEQDSQVQVQGSWQPDTLTLYFRNPRRLPITWLLRTRTKEIRGGVFTDSAGEIKVPVDPQRQWNLGYEYFWHYPRHETTTIYRLDKQLEVSIRQAPRINPGETVDIQVKVQDQYGRPAARVQLAAAAVNGQFDSPSKAYLPPSVPYKTSRKHFIIENFKLVPLRSKQLSEQAIHAAWFRKLHLSDFPFYQMRYQNSGLWIHRDTLNQDTFYRQQAQVAPYLIRDHRAIPIYLIYLNNELVYYSGSIDATPYSFVGLPGYNRLTLRTHKAEYTLDSVWLEKGKKLELAVAPDHFRAGTTRIRLQRQARPAYWTPQEKFILRQNLLAIHPRQAEGEYFFWDQSTNIHRLSLWSQLGHVKVLGPFPRTADIHLVARGQWEKSFSFEPGFSYHFDEKRERLYEWKAWNNRTKMPLSDPAAPPVPGEYIYRPEDIRRDNIVAPRIDFDLPENQRQPGLARLRLLNYSTLPDTLPMLALVLQSEKGTEWLIPANRESVGLLAPGKFQVFLVRQDGRVKRRQIELRANTTLGLDLAAGVFEQDSLRLWPDHLYMISKTRLLNRETSNSGRPGSTNPYEGRGRLIQGRLTDSNGEPLIGASILIKGTSTGTITDIDGSYTIWVPEGDPTLTFSYTGFNSTEYQVGHSQIVNTALEGGVALDEVVVTGYGIQQSNFAAGDPLQALQGKVAGVEILHHDQRIMIRGSHSTFGAAPLILINGRRATIEEVANIPPELIRDIRVLEGAEATALYGSAGSSGVYIINTNGQQLPLTAAENELESASGLRDQFRDHAFWQPYLTTDQNGEAFFQVTYPDNITAWNTYVLGMDRKQRAGIGLARTQAWKSLTARLNLPRFMIVGDEAKVIGQAVNYTDDSLRIATFFRQGETELARQEHLLGNTLTDNYTLIAPAGTDSVSLIYGLENGDYLDGEERELPVFPVGSLETEGHFAVLHGDTTLEWSFDQNLPISVFAADQNLDLLQEDLDYLRHYPHACMEQTAGRLIALCLEKQVRQQLQGKFDGEGDLRKMLRRLEKAQQADGSWGWWPGSAGSLWITLHVLEAIRLSDAAATSFASLQKGLRYLVHELPAMESKDRLLTLDFLAKCRQPLDYNRYLDPLDTVALSLHQRLLTTRIRQRMELPYQLDTLDKYRQQTLYGAYYWGEETAMPMVYRRLQHPIATTLIAYELLRDAGRSEEARQVQQYFLENRGIGQAQGYRAWYNTYETARILATILPDMLDTGWSPRPNQLSIQAGKKEDVAQFPYTAKWSAGERMTIHKTGSGPLYLSAYQQYQNPQPEARSDIFFLTTKMIQQEVEVRDLQQGTQAVLEVSLQSKVDAEYVMLEIPIPAGCSFGDRLQKRNGLEDHREYAREKVVIFCSSIPAGTHTFRVELEPRFKGRFTLNPARAEQMYFPVLFGRNGIRRLEIF